MRNIKTIFILVLSLILLFAVSCSNEDKTGGKVTPPSDKNGTRTLSYYAGDWWGNLDGSEEEGGHMLTVNVDDSVILRNVGSGSDLPIPSTDITKNSDTSYTFNIVMTGASGNVKLDFSSDTTGTLTLTQVESSTTMTIDITKR